MPNRKPLAAALALTLVLLSGCTEETVQARGFALPTGDAEAGRRTFVRLQCQQCHTVAGVELPADSTMRDGPTVIRLGGSVPTIKTQGDLVTSIINPSHKIVGWREDVTDPEGESIMTVYNNVMTVTELINLVEFLQAHYEFTPPVYPVP